MNKMITSTLTITLPDNNAAVLLLPDL